MLLSLEAKPIFSLDRQINKSSKYFKKQALRVILSLGLLANPPTPVSSQQTTERYFLNGPEAAVVVTADGQNSLIVSNDGGIAKAIFNCDPTATRRTLGFDGNTTRSFYSPGGSDLVVSTARYNLDAARQGQVLTFSYKETQDQWWWLPNDGAFIEFSSGWRFHGKYSDSSSAYYQICAPI